MSSAFETLLEAARYIELQEQRERLTSTSSSTSTSSLSTSPYSNSHYNHHRSSNSNHQNYPSHQSLVSTPPESPILDGQAYGSSSNGSTIIRTEQINRKISAEEPFFKRKEIAEQFTSQARITTNTLQLSQKSDNYHFNHPYPMLIQSNYNTTANNDGSSIADINHTPTITTIINTTKATNTINKPNTIQYNYSKAQSLSPPLQQRFKNHYVDDAMLLLSRSRSSSLTSKPITANGVHHVMQNGEDSSQSSLNLSASSGYLSGSSANSSVGGSNLNLSVGATVAIGSNNNACSPTSSMSNGTASVNSLGTVAVQHHINSGLLVNGNGVLMIQSNGNSGSSPTNGDIHLNNHYHSQVHLNGTQHLQQSSLQQQQQQNPVPQLQTTNSRRRTISSNSNGGTQRSPSNLRAGTREVHNKLEKNRRAHLKECFEQLKRQLPHMQDEKKTSNLLILSNASKYIQVLNRKDRELEHEMERLAKEKISKQQQIFLLRRELSARFDNFENTIQIPEGEVSNGIRERVPSESLSEQSLSGRARYSSTSSLSSAATASSPCMAGVPSQSAMTTSISPVITTASSTMLIASSSSISSSPQRAFSTSPVSASRVNATIPLSMLTNSTAAITAITTTTSTTNNNINNNSTIKTLTIADKQKRGASQPPTSTSLSNGTGTAVLSTLKKTSLPNGLTANSNGLTTAHNQISINLSTTDGISPALLSTTNAAAALPINLNINAIHQQIPNGSMVSKTAVTSNGLQIISTSSTTNGNNGFRHQSIDLNEQHSNILSNGKNPKEQIKLETIATKLDAEPPTKVIKLFNGNTIALAPMDKDNKLISSGQLTLSQVVVSQIPLLAPTQTLRVIGQAPHGLATIELSKTNARNQIPNQQHTATSAILPNGTNGAHLHKLLVSAASPNLTAPMITSTIVNGNSNGTPELARLPGGAELNILPTGTNGTALYRGNGKLTIIKGAESNQSNRVVHMVNPLQSNANSISGLTPIVVSPQGQNCNNLAHIIASTPQLTGKVNLSFT